MFDYFENQKIYPPRLSISGVNDSLLLFRIFVIITF